MADIQDTLCGKTYQEHSAVTEERTSDVSSKASVRSKTIGWQYLDLGSGNRPEKSWEMTTQSHGECWMHSIGVCPNVVRESFLSQILQIGGGAGEVLFKCESMPRNSQESEEQKQETSGIIGNCTDDAVTVYENHTQDCRYRELGQVSSTLASNLGTGGNNQPLVVKKVYRICSKDSNAMKSDNPHSGFYETDKASTVDTSNQSPCKNQGGIVVIEGNGIRPSHMGDGYKECETMYTLNTTERHAVAFSEVHGTLSANDGPKGPSSQMLSNPEENFVAEPAYGLDRASFNQGMNAKYDFSVTEESEPTMTAREPNAVAQPVYTTSKASFHTKAHTDVADTLVASDFKDHPLINQGYTVRRLTPTECARLQGFPDWWCSDLATPEPTAEDIEFWRNVFETHRKIMGTSKKAKTDKQIAKWLKDPHTDSAEYKMWGNGVALPCVQFIMHQIAERDAEEEWHRQVMEEMTIQQLMEQEPELFEG